MNKKLIIAIVLAALSVAPARAQKGYSLEYCKQAAAANNAKIKNARAEIECANQVVGEAYTNYFPNVSLMGAGLFAAKDLIEMEQKGGNLPVYDGNPANLGSATQFAFMPDTKISMLDKLFLGELVVMQPIYAGGRISNGNRLAELAVEINKNKLGIEQYAVAARAEELYRKLVSTLEKRKTIDAYIKFLTNLQKDVNTSLEAGLVDKKDALTVSIKLNELKLNRITLENGISMLKEALCQHIGIEFDPDFAPSDTTFDIKSPDSYHVDLKTALSGRHETQLLRNAVDAEALQSEIKKGEYMPQVAVGGALFGVNVLDKTSVNAVAFATISIPISDWWGASYTTQEHKIREEIARTNEKETAELLTLQISQAKKALSEAYDKIELAERMLDEARENFRMYTSNYSAGVVPLSDLLEAEATVRAAEDRITEYKSEYLLAVARYQQATGRY